jgi:uncharacterized protein DUF5615
MPKAFHKHKLLFDENMLARQLFPRLNEHFDVKHVRDDCNMGGSSDTRVYALATARGRVLITKNGRDFRVLVRDGRAGVVDVPDGWTTVQIDTKLTALLMRHGAPNALGNFEFDVTLSYRRLERPRRVTDGA